MKYRKYRGGAVLKYRKYGGGGQIVIRKVLAAKSLPSGKFTIFLSLGERGDSCRVDTILETIDLRDGVAGGVERIPGFQVPFSSLLTPLLPGR